MSAEPDGSIIDPDRLIHLRFAAAEAGRTRRLKTSGQPGPFVTKRRGRGSETDDIRTWSPGDDIRHVDRNVTARTGIPHVRTFRDERERTTLLFADFRAPMLFGTRRAFLSVAAAEVLALAGWSLALEGGRVGLIAVSSGEPELVRPATGERAMLAIVGALARAHRAALERPSEGDGPLAPHLRAAARSIPSGSSLMLATALDDPGSGFDDAVAQALDRVDVTAFLMTDAFEEAPPPGTYPFLDPAGRRGLGLVDGKAERAEDPRLARLRGLGIRAVACSAAEAPEVSQPVLEAIHGR